MEREGEGRAEIEDETNKRKKKLSRINAENRQSAQCKNHSIAFIK